MTAWRRRHCVELAVYDADVRSIDDSYVAPSSYETEVVFVFELSHGGDHVGPDTVHTVLQYLANSFISCRCIVSVCRTILPDLTDSLTISQFFKMFFICQFSFLFWCVPDPWRKNNSVFIILRHRFYENALVKFTLPLPLSLSLSRLRKKFIGIGTLE